MMPSKRDDIVLVGAGGHARVLAEALHAIGTPAFGYVADAASAASGPFASLQYLGDDRALLARGPVGIVLVNAVGSVAAGSRRGEIFERFSQRGFLFTTVVHPSAVLAHDVVLGDGAQIMAGAILQTGVRVGRNVIVNTRAVIDHDSCLADHVHVATGAILAGGVKVGEASHIGAGATVIQEITIGRAVLVAAGAVVVSDVADDASVAGIPARRIERSGSAA